MYKIDYSEYDASKFLAEELGVTDSNISTTIVEMKNGAKVKILHIEVVAPDNQSGDVLIWPAMCQTKSDIEKMPDILEDVRLRFGFHADETTGEIVAFKSITFVGYYINGEFINFNGQTPIWDNDLKISIWTNDEPN